jgi:hypothetical protein
VIWLARKIIANYKSKRMFKDYLRAINNLPIRLTIKHEETFGTGTAGLIGGELDSPEAWDMLRRSHPHFSVSSDREEWLQACEAKIKKDGQDGGLLVRAQMIAELLHKKRANAVFSVGVGGAGLEFQIKKLLPEIRVVCSEYAPENVELLRAVFTEVDEVIRFDMKGKDWSPALPRTNGEKIVTLMYRVDPHATDEEWRKIFENMHAAGVVDILYIPCGFLTLRSLFQRKWRIFRQRLKGARFVFSGYLRTRKAFESYWAGLYRAEVGNFAGYVGFYLQKEP